MIRRTRPSAVCTLSFMVAALTAAPIACSESDPLPADDADAGASNDAGIEGDGRRSDARDAKPTSDAGGDVEPRSEPTAQPLECQVDPCFERVSGMGGSAVCGLTTKGTVWCWGSDGKPDSAGAPSVRGALGRGVPVYDANEAATPRPIPSLDAVVELSVGRDETSCALRTDGAVWCWGTAPDLGFPNPPAAVVDLGAADRVVADNRMGCAVLREDQSAWCWGRSRELLPDALDSRPIRVSSVTGKVRQIGLAGGSQRFYYAMLLRMEDHRIVSWGTAPGRPTSKGNGEPTPGEIDSVSWAWWVGTFSFLADGRAYTWSGDLISSGARPVPRFDARRVIELAERVAFDANGDVFAWGSNAFGELGASPDALVRAEAPVSVKLPAKARSVAAAGKGAFCASLVDGSVACWGRNAEGQLGRRTRDTDPHPLPERLVP